ncbi:23S rRNA (uracil(1939)-C(5))-methyltransferase RlmD [Cyanobium sp. Morenito 9A2]|uniref:23S rRNA (uracil(1939)-C(5))-methyltransferase RlmD n=1 Tax=Cyanobium sp. Morenito 9A2 TaxID=2823718 RepID=UPI0020CEE6C7|nr:23S rRNA (uracil(1939)-C(5))-methyltransferase RlmD [Cyanobium sp. Morenito 9A2]MCP9850578.1 23S rRNA (uracil(1939)-C(5))-methyltransferase RlmD [Cyanobium sp. Morenito 9A2]
MDPQTPSLGTRLTVRITGLNHEGQGVGRTGVQVVFVDGALPGETVEVIVRHRAKRHLVAEHRSTLLLSPERRKPPCILADRCGGCSLQHLEDGAQARWKHDTVQQALRRIGGFELDVAPILAAESPLGYRNRAVIPLERTEEGKLRAGFYRSGSHRIVNMNRCPVLDPRLDRLIAPIKADLEQTDWPVDVDLAGEGGLRHLALRLGRNTGEVLITLISSHRDLPDREVLAEAWMERWPELVGVCLNLQPQASNTLLGPQTDTLAGRSWLLERFAAQELRIGADTFFQVNTAQAERLLPLLIEALAARAGTRLVDAYCGIGTFSLPLAATGASVVGLEQHPGSVEQARANAERNGLERCRFLATEVETALEDALAEADGLLLDPPRKGLAPGVCATIAELAPARVAYVSCNPATLARDLALFCAGGRLELISVQPIDFFPQTSHVECLAVLRRL